jgi:hypothetical protein
VDQGRCHGFFPKPVRLFQDTGQIVLELQRGRIDTMS